MCKCVNVQMKKILYSILCVLLLVGCKHDSQYVTIPQPDDSMLLRTSADTVVLDAKHKDEVAVTFLWSWPELQYGAKSYDYAFKLDVADNQFQTSIPKMALAGDNKLELNHKQLNDWLENWGIKAGQPTQLEAELIATPRGTDYYVKPMLSRTVFTVIGYANSLYMMGSATSAGDNYLSALPMEKIAGEDAYRWTGTLTAGEVSFVSEQTATAVKYGTFTIPRPGCYSLTYDMAENELTWFEPLFLIGSATEGGWNLGATTPMNIDLYPVITWTGVLTEGEFKFACHPQSGLFEDAFYNAPSADTKPEGTTGMTFNPDGQGEDNKWLVSEAGIYTLTVDMSALTVSFERDHSMDDLPVKAVWICGDATPGGWNTPFPEKMAYDFSAPLGTFVWKGNLKAGEIKFPCNSSSYEGAFFLADDFNMSVTPDQTYRINYFSQTGGVDDKKWIVQEGGNYKIVLNVVDNTVKFVKQ